MSHVSHPLKLLSVNKIISQPYPRLVLFYRDGTLISIIKKSSLTKIFSNKSPLTPLEVKIVTENETEHTFSSSLIITHPLIPCKIDLSFILKDNTLGTDSVVSCDMNFSEQQKIYSGSDSKHLREGCRTYLEYILVAFSLFMSESNRYLFQYESAIIKGSRSFVYDCFQKIILRGQEDKRLRIVRKNEG